MERLNLALNDLNKTNIINMPMRRCQLALTGTRWELVRTENQARRAPSCQPKILLAYILPIKELTQGASSGLLLQPRQKRVVTTPKLR